MIDLPSAHLTRFPATRAREERVANAYGGLRPALGAFIGLLVAGAVFAAPPPAPTDAPKPAAPESSSRTTTEWRGRTQRRTPAKTKPQPTGQRRRRTAQPATRRRQPAQARRQANRRLPAVRRVAPAGRRLGGGALITRPVRPTPLQGGVLPGSEEADNWLRRAAEGIEREDWKLAVDALQRLVETGGDVVTTADKKVYYSARRHAHEMIAGLGEAGRRTYRLIHDPEAKRFFERGVRDHDEAALLEVVSRFLLTSYGDDACDVLASWWLDDGRAAQAAAILTDLLEIYPDSDRPLWAVRAKLALAEALVGERELARKALSDVPSASVPDAEARARLAAVTGWVERIAPPTLRDDVPSWPLLLGDAKRNGRMPPVSADALRATPLVHRLPTYASEDRGRSPSDKPTFPTSYAVTDGDQVIVKTDSRLVALDAISLETLWESVPLSRPRAGSRRTSTGRMVLIGGRLQPVGRQRGSIGPDVDFEGLGSVALAHGMAFVVDRSGAAVATDGDVLFVQQQGAVVIRRRIGGRTVQGDAELFGSRLLAFDLGGVLADGRPAAGANPSRTVAQRSPRWVVGTRREDSELYGATFLAPPIAVGRHLLVPYLQKGDLYAGVLDPEDGHLVRKVHLCGAANGWIDLRAVLHVAEADQIAYVPTGQGLLVAINTSDYSIRWVSRYPRSSSSATNLRRRVGGRIVAPPQARLSGEGWLSGPPVIVGRHVLLAATDSDRIFAFDRRSGRIVWDRPRDQHQYILGVTSEPQAQASGSRVILGGKQASALDLATGEPVWTVPLNNASGRGALVRAAESGPDQLFMPTERWLVILDAATGDVRSRIEVLAGEFDDPDGAESTVNRLGNLLCWSGSLFSVERHAIRAFPDVARAYQLTRSVYETNPGDPLIAMRLASLELLRENPQAAVDILDAIADVDSLDDRRRLRLSRIQVRSLLRVARQGDLEPTRVISTLRRAFDRARAPADWLASGLALASQLAETGDPVGAMQHYADLCLSGYGADLLRPPVARDASGSRGAWSGRAWCRVWRIVGTHLGPVRAQLAPDELDAVERDLMTRLEQAIDEDDPDRITVLANARLLPAVAQRANLYLGRRALADEASHYEQADFYLTRAVGAAMDVPLLRDEAVAAEALARLVVTYIQDQSMLSAGMVCLQQLAALSADQVLPPDLAIVRGAASPDARGVPVADFVDYWLAQVPDDRRGEGVGTTAVTASPTIEMIGRIPQLHAWPIHFRRGRPEAAADRAFFLIDDRNNRALPRFTEAAPATVQAHALEDLALEWPAELVFEQDPIVGRASQADEAALFGRPNLQLTTINAMRTRPSRAPAYALAYGQTMIVTSEKGVHAIGLASGLRLWARAASGPEPMATGSDRIIALADPDGPHAGHLAMILDPTVLELADAQTGRTIWRHEMAQGELAAVRMIGDYVVAVSQTFDRAWTFSMADGNLVSSVAFRTVAARGQITVPKPIDVVLFDHIICGPNGNGVIAYDLRSGAEVWRRAIAAPLASLFKPRPDVLGVGTQTGQVSLIRPDTGTVVLTTPLPQIGGPVLDGVLHEGVLVVLGQAKAARVESKVVGVTVPADALEAIAGTDPAGNAPSTGQVRWEMTVPAGVDPSQLRAAGNAIPVLEMDGNTGITARPGMGRMIRVTLIDKVTGERIGQGAKVPLSRSLIVEGAIEVWPGYIIVGGPYGAVAFRTSGERPAPRTRTGAARSGVL